MRRGQEAARRFHEEPERSSDFLCLPDLEDLLFCLRKKRKKNKAISQCGAACDRYGYHLQQCPSGGGYFVGHDTVCAEFGDLAGGSEGIPGVVVDWKSQVAAWPRSTRGYEADLGLFHIPGERDIYLDGVLSLANPRTYRGCENKAGKVAEL